jgi:hypothetical protein
VMVKNDWVYCGSLIHRWRTEAGLARNFRWEGRGSAERSR